MNEKESLTVNKLLEYDSRKSNDVAAENSQTHQNWCLALSPIENHAWQIYKANEWRYEYGYASENGQKLINLKHFNCRIFSEIRWKWNEMNSDEKKTHTFKWTLRQQIAIPIFMCSRSVWVCPSNAHLI